MKLKTFALLMCFLASGMLAGCGMVDRFTNPFVNQTDMASQTLPSGLYSRGDVQYFPPGSEEQLPNLKRALEQYKLEQQQYELERQGDTIQE